MHIDALQDSKFLKKENTGKNGILVTIAGVEQQNVAMADDEPEMKWCLTFQEDVKPMVLNKTNSNLIASITGKPDTDDWPGEKIVLYNDPTIMFAGKMVGGIRVRAPKNKPAAPIKAAPAAEDTDSSVPF